MDLISKKLVANDLINAHKDHNITVIAMAAGLATVYLFSLINVAFQGALLVAIYLGWRFYANEKEINRIRRLYLAE